MLDKVPKVRILMYCLNICILDFPFSKSKFILAAHTHKNNLTSILQL